MKIDFTFLHSNYELSAIDEYLAEIRRHRNDILSTFPPSYQERLTKASESQNPYELDIELQLVNESANNILPRLYLNTATVALYSTFEFCIIDITRAFQTKRPDRLKFTDLRSSNLVSQCITYFTKVVELDHFASEPDIQQLQLLRKLRNCIVHSSGKLEFVKASDRAHFETLKENGKGLTLTDWDDSIIVEEHLLMTLHAVVNRVVRDLIIRTSAELCK